MNPALICRVGDAQYAIPVADIVEVAAMVRLTHLPETPPEILGITNRHGEVMPILDLRRCLNHPAPPPDLNSLFVVVRGPAYLAGLVVDDILEVSSLPTAALQPPAQSGPYVSGMAIINQQPLLVLDVAALLRNFAPSELPVESVNHER